MFLRSPPVHKMGITAFSLFYKSDLKYHVLIRRRSSDTQIGGIAIDMGLMCSNSCFCQVSCVRVLNGIQLL